MEKILNRILSKMSFTDERTQDPHPDQNQGSVPHMIKHWVKMEYRKIWKRKRKRKMEWTGLILPDHHSFIPYYFAPGSRISHINSDFFYKKIWQRSFVKKNFRVTGCLTSLFQISRVHSKPLCPSLFYICTHTEA